MQKDLCELCIYPPTIFHNLSRDFIQISKKSSCSLLNIHSGDEKPVLFFFKSYLIGLVHIQNTSSLIYKNTFSKTPLKRVMDGSFQLLEIKNIKLSLLLFINTSSLQSVKTCIPVPLHTWFFFDKRLESTFNSSNLSGLQRFNMNHSYRHEIDSKFYSIFLYYSNMQTDV